MSEVCNFSVGSGYVGFAEKIAGLGVKLSPDYVFMCFGIPVNNNAIDGSLFAFKYAHFDIDGIILGPYFNRIDIEKEIPIIHVCG